MRSIIRQYNSNMDNLPAVPVSPKPLDQRKIAISKLKRRLLKHVWILRVLIFVGVLLSIFLLVSFAASSIKKSGFGLYFGLVKDFVFTPIEKIESMNDRTNILILGKAGAGHEAPDLTDTIIFASVSHKYPSVVLISLPRDIWIPQLRTKLNSIYYWGNQKQPPDQKVSGLEVGGGIVLAKATVEEIVGQPIHYGAVVDFSGFKKVIDVMGQIEVNVERSFVDEKYPISGREDDQCEGDPEYKCRYEAVRFEAGRRLMDGETALKFVRSRNAQGDEGTDLARESRQQKVIQAIKEKILSREILLSPKKLIALKNTFLESIETDITPSAGAILGRRILTAKNEISSRVLSEGLLENPPYSRKYDNLYVFIPKDDPSAGSGQAWEEVHKWVGCILENGDCD